MGVKLRLARIGAKKRPMYRVIAAESRSPRDGSFLDRIGIYDPNQNPALVRLDQGKLEHWLSVGAVPTEIVWGLIRRARAQETDGQKV